MAEEKPLSRISLLPRRLRFGMEIGMKVGLLVAGILLVCLAAAIVGAVYLMSKMLLHPKTQKSDVIKKGMETSGTFDTAYYDSLQKERVQILSRYGYELLAEVLDTEETKKPENRRKVAVLCHGFTSCRYGMFPYAKLYLSRGFTVVLYDHRNHGDNTPLFTTMGYYEREDLKTVLDWCEERFGKDVRIVTQGESMGSATVLSHLEIDDRVVCAVADCGYSDLKDLLLHLSKKWYHLRTGFFTAALELFVRLRHGFSVYDVRPEEGAKKSKTPILFVHGEDDTFVPTWMSKKMYAERTGAKELLLIPGAEHAQCIYKAYEEYDRTVGRFLEQYYDEKVREA